MLTGRGLKVCIRGPLDGGGQGSVGLISASLQRLAHLRA